MILSDFCCGQDNDGSGETAGADQQNGLEVVYYFDSVEKSNLNASDARNPTL
jgi:hypothetical protein